MNNTRTLIWILLLIVVGISSALFYIVFVQDPHVEKIRNVGTDQLISSSTSGNLSIGTSTATSSLASTTGSYKDIYQENTYAGDYASYIQNYFDLTFRYKKEWGKHTNSESGFSALYPKDMKDSVVSGIQSYFSLKLPEPETIDEDDQTSDVLRRNVAFYIKPQTTQSVQVQCFAASSDVMASGYKAVGNQLLLRLGAYSVYKQSYVLTASDFNTYLTEYSFYLRPQVCYKAQALYQLGNDSNVSPDSQKKLDAVGVKIQNVAESIIGTLTTI